MAGLLHLHTCITAPFFFYMMPQTRRPVRCPIFHKCEHVFFFFSSHTFVTKTRVTPPFTIQFNKMVGVHFFNLSKNKIKHPQLSNSSSKSSASQHAQQSSAPQRDPSAYLLHPYTSSQHSPCPPSPPNPPTPQPY